MTRETLLKKSAQRIGEILVKRGWISNEALGRALDTQAKPATRRVGDILKESGQVTEEQLAEALAEQYHLQFISGERLAAGWRVDTAVYTFRWKYLRLLPMRDPDNHQWLLVTESTADEKLMLPLDAQVDLAQVRFGVVATTMLDQLLSENPAANELQSPPVVQQLTLPSKPDPSLTDARAALPGLAQLEVPRILRIVGALWGQCAAELQRAAVVSLELGTRFRVEVRQIVAEAMGELPPGYVAPVTSAIGRSLDVRVIVPRSTVEGHTPDLAWPPVWPPPDLAETVQPMLEGLCKVPASLRTNPDSLRWMGTRSAARDALNRHLIAAAGITLGSARIDDFDELWAATRARARALDANQAVRNAWDRWRPIAVPALEILPGNVLALACLASGFMPKKLAPVAHLALEPGQVVSLELSKHPDAADDDPGGVCITLTHPFSTP